MIAALTHSMPVPPSRPPGSVRPEGELAPPLWAQRWVEDGASIALPVPLESLEARRRAGDGYAMTSVRLRDADAMDILTFQQSVGRAYRVVLDQIQTDHALRFWAFVPQIHVDYGQGLDRYMAFNAGRFAAFSTWVGGPGALSESMPTGSAVGTRGTDLTLHCLVSRWPGHPVENPRQVPSYRYSQRFGPLPPCFARGTLVRCGPFRSEVLLVAGTASIVGEDSLHPGDALAQTDETLRNLASVARSAWLGPGAGSPDEGADLREWLSLFRELRVYFREPSDQSAILSRVQASFPAVERVEALPAELCRAELLVEIEGLALPPPK